MLPKCCGKAKKEVGIEQAGGDRWDLFQLQYCFESMPERIFEPLIKPEMHVDKWREIQEYSKWNGSLVSSVS